MADNMNSAYKNGNSENCKDMPKIQGEYKRLNNYCIANFPKDPAQAGACKMAFNPCEFCCENEFGDMYIEKRKTCAEKYCTTNKDKPSSKGRWIWEKFVNNNHQI